MTGRARLINRLWAGSGALTVVLFGCGLLFGDLLGSSNYPPLDASNRRLLSYFLGNGSEVRALAFFHVLAALALLCFVAYLHDWLRDAATSATRLATLALAGGAVAAAFLLLSALIYRVLAEPSVVRDPPLARALVIVSYLAGGPAIAVPLTMPVAAVTTAALRRPFPPRWTGWLGIPAAVLSLASVVTLLGPMNNTSAAYGILLLGALFGFVWLFATSLVLTARSPLDGVGLAGPGDRGGPGG